MNLFHHIRPSTLGFFSGLAVALVLAVVVPWGVPMQLVATIILVGGGYLAGLATEP